MHPRFLSVVSLLVLACGDAGGGETGSSTSAADTTGGSEPTGTGTGPGASDTSTGTPTEAGAESSTGGAETTGGEPATTSGEPATTTGDTDTDTTDTTGEPMPVTCDGMPVPEPVNEYLNYARLIHVPDEQRYYLAMDGGDENAWWLTFELGAEEPVVGTLPGLMFSGQVILGEAGGSSEGTVTLELIAITEDCVLGRISEVMEDPEWFIDQELPGGFFAVRQEQ